ncbi:polyhydroxyalkanoate depolymerase [Temperatibacter marinus]|uniref:Polyhydroxyalkanoate depolymerase n=1 Tax=Temperatibacter marinus TaxID=1456591 RepID=A0AA52EH94_9PROT|nr:polyhydroxyalkanoate depolymerase [Temperatibacter marinus]WND02755.1 polyhydroxyalkanoate depolymerase [Temperatibacter marinus]
MLYTFYEMQQMAFAPMRYMATQGQKFYSNPTNPVSHTPAGRFASASFDILEQLTRRYGKPKFGLTSTIIEGQTIEVEEQIVSRRPFGQLKHFKRKTHCSDPRVLIVAPMSGHYATLLRGTVEALLPDHDVYITDWRDARKIPMTEGSFDLDDYVDYIVDWLEDLGPNTHILAVCQPCVPVYAALALMSEEDHPCTPASMTLMGGPIDTRKSPTEVNQLAQDRPYSWFENNVITMVPAPNPGMMRKVYPGFLQLAGFMTMNLGDHVDKHNEMFEKLVTGDGESANKTRAFYEEYRAVMDMTAEFYLQTIDIVFQRHLLPDGKWVSKGRTIKPEAINETAILAIEGELDDISGQGQTKAALDISTSLPHELKDYYLAPKVGHYGIFNGRRWREDICPRFKDFVRKHDQKVKKKTA